MIILILLPLFTLLLLIILIYSRSKYLLSHIPLREAFLASCVILGYGVSLFTEAISVFNSISFSVLLSFWVIITFLLLVCLIYHRDTIQLKKGISRLPISGLDWVLIFCIGIIAFVILITGLASAPNNYDSMTYHLGRVIHWIQNQSLSPYATNIQRQLFQAPFAEILTMHLQILTNSDRFAFGVQFFSMVGSLIGVSLITGRLGGTVWAQILSAFLCVTIPMGILQASSTQNDYVVSFLLVCSVYFLLCFRDQQIWRYALLTGASFGLALYTKQTALIFGIPFLFLIPCSIFLLRRKPVFNEVKKIGLFYLHCGFIAVFVNIGFFWRNFIVYLDILGRPVSSLGTTNTVISLSGMFLNSFRNIGLHLGVPGNFEPVFMQVYIWWADIFQLNLDDNRYTFGGYNFSISKFNFFEDLAGNFILLLLILFIGILFLRTRMREKNVFSIYFLCLLGGYLMFSLFLAWQPWGSRLQLPLFVLFTPLAGYYIGKYINMRITTVLICFLIISSTPFLIMNSSRSFIGYDQKFFINNELSNLTGFSPFSHITDSQTSTTRMGVVFSPRQSDYFSRQPYLEEQYGTTMQLILQNNINKVGLDIGGDDWEYPFWAISRYEMNHPVYLEHVGVENPSKFFQHSKFVPEMVISTQHQNEDVLFIEGKKYQIKEKMDNISLFLPV